MKKKLVNLSKLIFIYPEFDDEKCLPRSAGIEIFESADVIWKFVVDLLNIDFLYIMNSHSHFCIFVSIIAYLVR